MGKPFMKTSRSWRKTQLETGEQGLLKQNKPVLGVEKVARKTRCAILCGSMLKKIKLATQRGVGPILALEDKETNQKRTRRN